MDNAFTRKLRGSFGKFEQCMCEALNSEGLGVPRQIDVAATLKAHMGAKITRDVLWGPDNFIIRTNEQSDCARRG